MKHKQTFKFCPSLSTQQNLSGFTVLEQYHNPLTWSQMYKESDAIQT